MAKRAWILHYKDIAREDGFSTYLSEAAALKEMASAIASFAKDQLESIEWGEDDPKERLNEVIALEKKGKHADAVEAWRDFDFDYGPSDQNVFLIDSVIEG